MTCVLVSMVSTHIQIHLFVIFSILVLMDRPRRTLAHLVSGSMSTLVSATGQIILIDKTARRMLMVKIL